MRIMVVDDNDLMRKEIIRFVSGTDDVVFECGDGKSAVNNCFEFHPDWILMDIKMKNMNGFTAAEKIKKDLPGVKIAFVTCYDNIGYREKARSMGIENYFLKSNLISIREKLEMMNNEQGIMSNE